MAMRRTQVLLEERQYQRLREEAERTGRSIGALVRDAVDARLEEGEVDRLAANEGRDRRDVVREMVGVYRTYRETGRFEALQRYGAARARAIGATTEEDVDRLIQQARRG